MPFPVLGSNSAVAEYEIDNSLRFNDDDSPSLSRTPSSASNRKTWTWSGWVKRGNLNIDIMFLSSGSSGQGVYLTSGNQFQLTKDGVGNYGSTSLLRDVSAWYHLVVAVDTTQTGMSNIAKFYINGVQQTASGATIYSTNEDTNINNNVTHYISRWSGTSAGNHHDGYLAEVNFIDGQQLAPTEFGETNDNGVWIPKRFSGSYGTNGFKLEFKNSGSLGTDTSGNGNNFTATNLTATDQTTDTPTNNFATLNAASNLQSGTLSEGNCKLVSSTSTNSLVPSTMGVQNGKWYVEVKASSTNYPAAGILNDAKITESNQYLGKSGSLSRFIRYDGQKSTSNSNSIYMASWNGGSDILQIALDMDNGKITFGKNGQWGDGSGNSDETFANSTPAFTDIISSGDYTGSFAMLIFSDENQGTSDTLEVNFGNPSFTISSGNSDANGYGNFEYAPPTNYYSLCSKNLAEYG